MHKTKEQREHNKTLFPNPNQNNNGSFVLRHLSPVHESLPHKSNVVPLGWLAEMVRYTKSQSSLLNRAISRKVVGKNGVKQHLTERLIDYE